MEIRRVHADSRPESSTPWPGKANTREGGKRLQGPCISGSRQISDYRSRPALFKAYPGPSRDSRLRRPAPARLRGRLRGAAAAFAFDDERSNGAFHCRQATAVSLVPQQRTEQALWPADGDSAICRCERPCCWDYSEAPASDTTFGRRIASNGRIGSRSIALTVAPLERQTTGSRGCRTPQ